MCGPAWRKHSYAKVSLSGDSELGSWKLWRRGFGMEEGVRLRTMCIDWVFVLRVRSLHMSTQELQRRVSGGLPWVASSLFAGWRWLSEVFALACSVFSEQPNPIFHLKFSAKKFGKSGCTLLQSQRLNGWRELSHS